MESPLAQNERVCEAQQALREIGLPRQQQNTRTGLVLLSMLNLGAGDPWSSAQGQMLGVAQSMDWMADNYPDVKKENQDPVRYRTGSRESVRKYSIHQMVAAGVLVQNADDMDRATNSGDYSYQPTEIALEALRSFGTPQWPDALAHFHKEWVSLRERWEAERARHRVPVRLLDDTMVTLSEGKHSALIAAIVEDFAAYFTPAGKVIYLGDTGQKRVVNEDEYMAGLGIVLDPHGKMPDVLIHLNDDKRDWLVCIEAYHSVGEVDAKRVDELRALFAGCRPGLVFVSAFTDKTTFRGAAANIAWETDVWIREAPTHLIHFDGERFLGPYDQALPVE